MFVSRWEELEADLNTLVQGTDQRGSKKGDVEDDARVLTPKAGTEDAQDTASCNASVSSEPKLLRETDLAEYIQSLLLTPRGNQKLAAKAMANMVNKFPTRTVLSILYKTAADNKRTTLVQQRVSLYIFSWSNQGGNECRWRSTPKNYWQLFMVQSLFLALRT